MQSDVIVSHRHRFIFFAVPRTGSHAIRGALQPHLGEEDWQQQVLTARLLSPAPQLARIGHGHITPQQAHAGLPEPVWQEYFKFAIVRNPYDRFVSACAFLHRDNPLYPGNELIFGRHAMREEQFRRHMLLRPQVEMLLDESGRLAMDFIGRYETLDESFAQACRMAGLPDLALSRINASERPAWRVCYDAPLLETVTEFYRGDFDLLEYPEQRSLAA